MENDYNIELELEMINDGILDKQLKHKKAYSGQKTDRPVIKWKSGI